MTRHLTSEELDSYRQRMMPAADLLVANDHLASCEECYSRFYPKGLLESTYNFARMDLEAVRNEDLEHLSFDQILAYIDNELDGIERAIAETHIEVCSECDGVVRDLQQFKSDLALGKVYAPSPQPAFKDRIATTLRHIVSYRVPINAVALGVAAALVLWFIASLWFVTLSLKSADRRQVAATRQPQPPDVVAGLQARMNDMQAENQRLLEIVESMKTRLGTVLGEEPVDSSRFQIAINDDHGQITLNDRGGLGGMRFISSEHRQAVKDALRTGHVEPRSDLSDLFGKPGQMMGEKDKSFAPVSPVGTVVATNTPTFRWNPLPGATGYTVVVYRDDLKREAVSSQQLTGTEWTSPPLERGRTYFWQIRAVKGSDEIVSPSQVVPEARFKTLNQSQIGEVERARRLYSKSHLTLGVLYARMGLLEDAASEFRILRTANPTSMVVDRLLRSVTKQPNQ